MILKNTRKDVRRQSGVVAIHQKIIVQILVSIKMSLVIVHIYNGGRRAVTGMDPNVFQNMVIIEYISFMPFCFNIFLRFIIH